MRINDTTWGDIPISPPLAIAMSIVAMVIPPFAAVVANWNIDRRG